MPIADDSLFSWSGADVFVNVYVEKKIGPTEIWHCPAVIPCSLVVYGEAFVSYCKLIIMQP